jgi:CTP synthase (UTP-ammonia lyase)
MRIAAMGDRDTRHLTHREVDGALALFPAAVAASWVGTDSRAARSLDDVDGVWLLPGTPYRDEAAAHAAIRHCLDTGTPLLATCGGFQHACVELVRRLTGAQGAAHAESSPDAAEPVVVPLACALYGEVRTVHPVPGTRLAAICGDQPFDGFHWCGYGLADAYAAALRAHGVVISATAQDAGVEAIELPDHPFFLGTAFQPQVGAAGHGRLHPLLVAFLQAAQSFAGGALPASAMARRRSTLDSSASPSAKNASSEMIATR